MAKDKRFSDEFYMELALAEAKKGRYTTSPNPAVGCVIVRNGAILGMGYHHCAGQPHAEIMALRSANYEVEGATCYVTLEPCAHYGRTPPCARALVEAQVKRVVIGSTDPNPLVAGKGIAILEEAGIKVDLMSGKLKDKCLQLNRAFFKSVQTRKPWVFVKFGMSLDGKIALSTGESKWITNHDSRSDVQRLRLWADAIITSRTTVEADNPRMTVRVDDLPPAVSDGLDTSLIKQPIKLIIDSQAKLCRNRDKANLDPYTIFSCGTNYIVVGTHAPLPSSEPAPDGAVDPQGLAAALTTTVSALPTAPTADASAPALLASASPDAAASAAATAAAASAVPAPAASVTTDSITGLGCSCGGGSATTAAMASAPLASASAPLASAAAMASAPLATMQEGAASLADKTASSGDSGWVIAPTLVVKQGANFVVEKWTERVSIVVVPLVKGEDGLEHVSLPAVLNFLGSLETRVAMVEGGAHLAGAFLKEGLVDECYCYISPMILGTQAQSAFALNEPTHLDEALHFAKTKVHSLGTDIRLTLSEPSKMAAASTANNYIPERYPHK